MPARGFVFRLQPVLEQRERLEEHHTLRVAEIERERLAVEGRLRDIQGQIVAAKQGLRDELVGARTGGGPVGPLHAVRMQAGASLHLNLRAQQAAIELAGVYKRLELARAELLKAATARKAVSLLKEQQHAAWKRERDRRENAEVDELATMRFARRSDRP